MAATPYLHCPLFKSVVATLTYMRRNRTQADIGESLGVSQPTISRAVSAITPLLAEALSGFVPTAEELGDGRQYIVDGTLLSCWTWRAHPELKSDKHKATGFKVLLACTLAGQLSWISDPVTASSTVYIPILHETKTINLLYRHSRLWSELSRNMMPDGHFP